MRCFLCGEEMDFGESCGGAQLAVQIHQQEHIDARIELYRYRMILDLTSGAPQFLLTGEDC